MSEHLPWSLIMAYGCMNGGIFATQELVRRADAHGRGLGPVPIQVSAALGTVASIGTLVHYFVMTPWYWVFVLFVIGIFVAAIIPTLVTMLLGRSLGGTLLAFGWIIFAIWANMIIARL
jgi:hypothetical protein